MVFRVQLSPEAEPERYAVRLVGRLKAVQLDERLRACASRPRELSPIVFRSKPRWFTPRLAAGGAELVGIAEYLQHMTEPM